MPIHVHPSLRAKEEALEQAGLLVQLNSQGVMNENSAEAAGEKVRIYPATEYRYAGVDYVPSPSTVPASAKRRN